MQFIVAELYCRETAGCTDERGDKEKYRELREPPSLYHLQLDQMCSTVLDIFHRLRISKILSTQGQYFAALMQASQPGQHSCSCAFPQTSLTRLNISPGSL